PAGAAGQPPGARGGLRERQRQRHGDRHRQWHAGECEPVLAAAGLPEGSAMKRPLQHHEGQALAEFLVVLLALAALLVLFPLVGKYQDISRQVQMASRYVAWQSTVRNAGGAGTFESAGDLARDVRKRFFGPTGSRIFTADLASAAADRNPLWT